MEEEKTEQPLQKMPDSVRRLMTKINGGKHYLPVFARVLWFRQVHPDWTIDTVCVREDEKEAVFKTRILMPDGRLVSSAHKKEDIKGFGDFVEKAETGSVGRALALAGFGTVELEEPDYDVRSGRLADTPQSPQPPKRQTSDQQPRQPPRQPTAQPTALRPAVGPPTNQQKQKDPADNQPDWCQEKILDAARSAEGDPFLEEAYCLSWFWQKVEEIKGQRLPEGTTSKWPSSRSYVEGYISRIETGIGEDGGETSLL